MSNELKLIDEAIVRLEGSRRNCVEALGVIDSIILARQGEAYVGISLWNGGGYVVTALPWVVLLPMRDHLAAIVVDNAETLASAIMRRREMMKGGKHEDAQDPTQPH